MNNLSFISREILINISSLIIQLANRVNMFSPLSLKVSNGFCLRDGWTTITKMNVIQLLNTNQLTIIIYNL